MWKTMWKVGKFLTVGSGQSPSGLAGSATSPKWGGFHAGKARAKRRPTKWGAGREAGLRGFGWPPSPHQKKQPNFYSQAAFFNNSV